MTKQQQAKAAKLVILVRYLLKQDAVVNGTFCKKGTVILRVRNYEGREYITILRRNKQHACNCAHKPSEKCPECYHILVGKRIENARAKAARKALKVTVQEVQDVLLLPEHCESLKYSLKQEGLVQAPNGNWVTPEQLANVPGAPREVYETARAQAGYGAGAQEIESRLARAGFMRR